MAASGEMDDREIAQQLQSTFHNALSPTMLDDWKAVVTKARELFGPSKEMLAVVEAAEAFEATDNEGEAQLVRDQFKIGPKRRKLFEMVHRYRLTLQPPKRYRVEPRDKSYEVLERHPAGESCIAWTHYQAEAARIAALLEADSAGK